MGRGCKAEIYDRIAGVYGFFSGILERICWRQGLLLLDVKPGEQVLELGSGTGHCLVKIAKLVGDEGMVYGLDVSPRMVEIAQRRLTRAGLADRVKLDLRDVADMPYPDNMFNRVFVSLVLETLDPQVRMKVLEKMGNLLKPGGKLVAISVAKGKTTACRLYGMLNRLWPNYIDCSPIDLEYEVSSLGFNILKSKTVKVVGFPLQIVLACPMKLHAD